MRKMIVSAPAHRDLRAQFAYLSESNSDKALQFFDAARQTFADLYEIRLNTHTLSFRWRSRAAGAVKRSVKRNLYPQREIEMYFDCAQHKPRLRCTALLLRSRYALATPAYKVYDMTRVIDRT